MRPTDILLARHGAFDGMTERLAGRQPVALNDDGLVQAEALARAAAAWGVTRVLSSPQARARQTAAIVAQACGTTVQRAEALDEVDFGAWTGRAFTDLADDPRWERFNAVRDDSEIPHGESLAAVQHRVDAGLRSAATAARGEQTMIVTHAEIIRAALLMAHRQTWAHWAAYEIGPGTVTWLRYSASHADAEAAGPIVRAIGEPPAVLRARHPSLSSG